MKNPSKREHLPVYGVGPFYGAGVIFVTAVSIFLSVIGLFSGGAIHDSILMTAFITVGILVIIGGFIVWKSAAIGKGSIDGYIKSNTLCTTGVYGMVRNPCYSGIMMMCTGTLLLAHNLWLLILPFVFWIAMTIMLVHTEERWLRELYGQEYVDYCKRVSRCIPWFPKKHSKGYHNGCRWYGNL